MGNGTREGEKKERKIPEVLLMGCEGLWICGQGYISSFPEGSTILR
jgi:hypothetical protein